MIKIDLSLLLGAIFFLFLMFLWGMRDIYTRNKPNRNIRRHVYQCSYCSRIVLREQYKSIWLCPVCKSYTENNHA